MGALLRASDCCLLMVIADRRADLHCREAKLDPRIRIEAVIEAAALLAIPVVVATGDREHSKSVGIRLPDSMPAIAPIAVPPCNTEWADSDLGKAIAKTKRGCLVLAGWWLESDVTFIALEAGTCGLDTFLLLDATACLDETVRRAAICRLTQSGVMSASTPQIIAEWARSETAPTTQSTLTRLAAGIGRPNSRNSVHD